MIQTPEKDRRWDMRALLDDTHLNLTPYDDSTWEVRTDDGKLLPIHSLSFVIINKEKKNGQ